MAMVLVVDDNAGLRTVVRAVLEADGHRVAEAQDGRQGLALLAEHRPAAMITDILMPNKEGFETIREARAVRPDLAIVAMSGGGGLESLDVLKIALQFGADQVLEKPFRPAQLRAALSQALDARRPG